MSYEQFLDVIVDKVKEYLDEGQEVMINPVRKNNNTILYGMMITSKDTKVIPTIYMESFYHMYQAEVSLDYIAKKILEVYKRDMPKKEVDMSFFRDFEKVKNRIIYRLVNAAQNKELLEEIPYIPFFDLAICFAYAFHSKELGDGMIIIRNEHMEQWNVTSDQLMALAEKNTPKLFPISFTNVMDVLRRAGIDDVMSEDTCPLFVLTNHKKIYGASALLYPTTLEFLAETMGDNFYIIPSSVHECLIMPQFDNRRKMDIDLSAVIHEINEKELAKEEVLSNHAFLYDIKNKELKPAQFSSELVILDEMD